MNGEFSGGYEPTELEKKWQAERESENKVEAPESKESESERQRKIELAKTAAYELRKTVEKLPDPNERAAVIERASVVIKSTEKAIEDNKKLPIKELGEVLNLVAQTLRENLEKKHEVLASRVKNLNEKYKAENQHEQKAIVYSQLETAQKALQQTEEQLDMGGVKEATQLSDLAQQLEGKVVVSNEAPVPKVEVAAEQKAQHTIKEFVEQYRKEGLGKAVKGMWHGMLNHIKEGFKEGWKNFKIEDFYTDLETLQSRPDKEQDETFDLSELSKEQKVKMSKLLNDYTNPVMVNGAETWMTDKAFKQGMSLIFSESKVVNIEDATDVLDRAKEIKKGRKRYTDGAKRIDHKFNFDSKGLSKAP